jgi:hypothetical protein
MRACACLLLFSLVAYASGDAGAFASASSEVRGWQTAAGQPPSDHELAAVVACEERAKSQNAKEPIEGCLADYGLYRLQ